MELAEQGQQNHQFFISRDRQVALHNHPLWKKSKYKMHFQSIGPLGRCFLEVQMSICLSVCVSVCVSICSLWRYRLNIFLPPLSEVGCPIFLEIQNPLGKIMERSGLRFEHFSLEMFLNNPQKKFCLNLPYKKLVETTLPNVLETSGQRVYR